MKNQLRNALNYFIKTCILLPLINMSAIFMIAYGLHFIKFSPIGHCQKQVCTQFQNTKLMNSLKSLSLGEFWSGYKIQIILCLIVIVGIILFSIFLGIRDSTSNEQQLQQRKTITRQFIVLCAVVLFLAHFYVTYRFYQIRYDISDIKNHFKLNKPKGYLSVHQEWNGYDNYQLRNSYKNSLNFIRNIYGQQYKTQENNMKELLRRQDKNISIIRSWILNNKFFFRLFYVIYRSIAPIGILILLLLMIVGYKYRIFLTISILGSLLVTIGLLLISSLSYQIINSSRTQLCWNHNLKAGFLLIKIDLDAESQIMKQILETQQPLRQQFYNSTVSKQLKYPFNLYVNLCETMQPYYTAVRNAQIQISQLIMVSVVTFLWFVIINLIHGLKNFLKKKQYHIVTVSSLDSD